MAALAPPLLGMQPLSEDVLCTQKGRRANVDTRVTPASVYNSSFEGVPQLIRFDTNDKMSILLEDEINGTNSILLSQSGYENLEFDLDNQEADTLVMAGDDILFR